MSRDVVAVLRRHGVECHGAAKQEGGYGSTRARSCAACHCRDVDQGREYRLTDVHNELVRDILA